VVENAVPDLPGQVETAPVPFQVIHHSQALLVVAEGPAEEGRQGFLAQMAEGRVAQIVSQSDGFGQVLVQPQGPGGGPSDLGHLERVGEPNAVMVALGRDEDLRLVLEATKRLRVDDAVAV
jgi:hypothetical protein